MICNYITILILIICNIVNEELATVIGISNIIKLDVNLSKCLAFCFSFLYHRKKIKPHIQVNICDVTLAIVVIVLSIYKTPSNYSTGIYLYTNLVKNYKFIY